LKQLHLRALLKTFVEKSNGRILIKEFPPATMTPRQIQAFVKKIEDRGITVIHIRGDGRQQSKEGLIRESEEKKQGKLPKM
jgi:ABC-type Zn uptake system ZnuABC Zn-binding protein ZnuA